ncbi:hypothetical protein BX666DRAFT_1932632 [Dichotomocladium elegans]|nr:hypothetical protein BX666DRAFT_1932632 [Dichotomocladium elegans]
MQPPPFVLPSHVYLRLGLLLFVNAWILAVFIKPFRDRVRAIREQGDPAYHGLWGVAPWEWTRAFLQQHQLLI